MASGFGTCSMTPRPDSQSRLMRHALQIIAERKQQVGPVAVTFTIGRIQSRSIPAAGAGNTPVNLPAVDQCVDGGHFLNTQEVKS